MCVGGRADNWLRLVSVALEVNAPLLVFKCAKSILATMEGRQVRPKNQEG